MSKVKEYLKSLPHRLGKMAAIVGAAVALFAVFLLCQGVNPLSVYGNMITSTLGTSYGIGQVLIKSTPFILIAVGTCVSAKAGLVNVGGEGQFAMGALFSVTAALFIGDSMPSFFGIVLMMLAGMIGGAFWSGLAGVLKIKANMNETLTTLIMNYIAYQIVSYFVFNQLKDPDSFNWPQTAEISENLRLPRIWGKVTIGIIIALLAAVLIWLMISKSKWGYSLWVIGGNANAALHAGINVQKVQMIAMLISGALAGFAGAIEISGVEERLRQTTGVNYGYLGFLAAWMAWNNPAAAIFTAVVIGFLSVAGNVLEISSALPSSTIQILMALVLLAILWKGKEKKSQ